MSSVNAPNTLTVARIMLAPVVVIALLAQTPDGSLIAGAAFGLAALTDGIDGYLARSRSTVTSFGTVMDSIADKLLIAAALIALASLDRVGAWVVAVVVGREVAVSLLRAGAAQRGVVISVSNLGKAKMVLQAAAVTALIVADPAAVWVQGLVYAAVTFTVISGADYFIGFLRQVPGSRVIAARGGPAGHRAGGAQGPR